jgi:hypothetical protein
MIHGMFDDSILHTRYGPYRSEMDNQMEALALHALFMSYGLELLAHGLKFSYGDSRMLNFMLYWLPLHAP